MAEEKRTTQGQAARRVAGLLANAEDAAKRGDLAARDTFLQKATALQHKYAIDQVLLEMQGQASSEEIVSSEFCRESNTPLVKAKRQLIVNLAHLYRGTPAMCGEWDYAKHKMNKRAYITVWAHASDLAFITQLYTSFILQMQTEMARDERITHEKVNNSWRVSYAWAWVRRVSSRLHQLESEQNREASVTGNGAVVALIDKAKAVAKFADEEVGGFKKSRRVPVSDKSSAGRAAGDAAGRRADLGQKRTEARTTQAIE
jgi:hypothetical protein